MSSKNWKRFWLQNFEDSIGSQANYDADRIAASFRWTFFRGWTQLIFTVLCLDSSFNISLCFLPPELSESCFSIAKPWSVRSSPYHHFLAHLTQIWDRHFCLNIFQHSELLENTLLSPKSWIISVLSSTACSSKGLSYNVPFSLIFLITLVKHLKGLK